MQHEQILSKKSSKWMTRFLWFTSLNVLALLGLGGLVTSKGVGMAVPDWPTTFGYNMFFLPWDKWVMGGGVFEEHSHRVFASWVGFLTLIIGGGLAALDTRKWVRRLGYLAVFLVILQGILGGLRVRLMKDEIGIFHAALAQVFLCLILWLSWCRTRTWFRLGGQVLPSVRQKGSALFWVFTFMIFMQLIFGAVMRHEHAGLAVPDFPTAYGSWAWPDTTESAIETINEERWINGEATGSYITAFQINVHMLHRLGAVLVTIAAVFTFWRLLKGDGQQGNRKLAASIALLMIFQISLGASTIWTKKSADVATFHMLTGAVILGYSFLLSVSATQARKNFLRSQNQSRADFNADEDEIKVREASLKTEGKQEREVALT